MTQSDYGQQWEEFLSEWVGDNLSANVLKTQVSLKFP